jgi:hypothetical protein
MSTMSTDLSDQSTLSGGSFEGQALLAPVDTEDAGQIHHLLGRLRTNFDKPPTEQVHHRPTHVHDSGGELPINSPDDPQKTSQLKRHLSLQSERSTASNDDESTVASNSADQLASKTTTTSSRRGRDKSSRKRSKSSSRKKRISRHASAPLAATTGKKRVVFGTVSVREYERCIGDNPAVSSGPPIGLGWYYLRPQPVDLNFYEAHVRKPAPRTRKDFFLTPQKRFHILLDEWGFSVPDICRAKDKASEIRYQRQISVFGDSVVPQLNSRSSSSSSSNSKKGQSYSSSKKNGGGNNKLSKLPRSQDRWNTSCPAAPAATTSTTAAPPVVPV